MSPRAWGCTGRESGGYSLDCNVPTCVGVYRVASSSFITASKCPHVRGGVPWAGMNLGVFWIMSPRAWGCTEVVAKLKDLLAQCPHVRGGVPSSHSSAIG